MSIEEKLSAIYQPLFDQLASQIAAQSRVNYSQYDMAIDEITDSKELPQVASGAAKRKLRKMMEQAYGLESLDALVDSIVKPQ